MQQAIKKVLVTGGLGFIGTNFIFNALKKNKNWHIINLDAKTYAANISNFKYQEFDKERYTLIKGNICNKKLVLELFKKEKFDYIFHFAAESHVDNSIKDPSIFLKTNILGTFNLLDACLKANLAKNKKFKFIHISTDEVYGQLGNHGLFSEKNPYKPSSPYSASKASSDHIVRAYFKTYNLPTIITNCSNNYGPFQYPEKLIPLTILNIIKKKPIPIYGDGKNVRDWLFVLDHCDALLEVLDKGKIGESYNIGTQNEHQNIEIVKIICGICDQYLGRKKSSTNLIKFVEDRAGHDFRYAIDSSKIEKELKWKAVYSFDEAIYQTVSWYIKNQKWLEDISKKLKRL